MEPDEIMLKFKHSKIESALQYMFRITADNDMKLLMLQKTKNNIATLTIEYSLLHTFNNQSVTAPMARS